ncbi:MAG: hypothetical protein GY811_27095 [Myxococcales bacterium]|nr:hypothetical protein [Myxococcales bacterium]
MFRSPLPLTLALTLAAACSADQELPGSDRFDDPSKRSCQADGSYDDGVCDLDCKTPDIDCFTVYNDASELSRFHEEVIAPIVPFPLVESSDPRHQHTSELLSEAWQAYGAIYRLGNLDVPSLLLVDDNEDPELRAFVIRDGDTVAWAVVVYSSFLDEHSDEMIIGTMVHEIAHAAGLHLFEEVSVGLRSFYIAPEGEPEPLGFLQPSAPALTTQGNLWFEAASAAGGYPLEELHDLPAGDSSLSSLLESVLDETDECFEASVGYVGIGLMLAENHAFANLLVPLTGERRAELDAEASVLASDIMDCLAEREDDFIDVMAEALFASPEEVMAFLSDEQLAAIEGKPLAEQFLAITSLFYGQMRAAEQAIEEQTGESFSRLRYFSIEEAADDSATRVLHAAGMSPTAHVDGFALRFGDLEEACQAALESGDVPYGNLTDNHHSPCWRIGHARAMAEYLSGDD